MGIQVAFLEAFYHCVDIVLNKSELLLGLLHYLVDITDSLVVVGLVGIYVVVKVPPNNAKFLD